MTRTDDPPDPTLGGSTRAPRADLPTGQVTFLFTDIEGSTTLLQRLGDAYGPLLEAHATILRRAIAEHGGVEVSTEGDAFFAVFPIAADAVHAAAIAQQRLASEAWPDGSTLRVRMGLHTGEGRRGGDNYVGLDVNRAARIAAAAHGGQVVLSAETRALAERTLPGGVSVLDLGTHRLKDLDKPEQIFQLSIDGLPTEFPALRSLGSHHSNLPRPLTDLVGRGPEIAAVAELLAAHRLVTLIGPGGTGKTRLSIAAASRLVDRFRDGVAFAALDVIRDASLVPSVMAQALGARETAEESPLAAAKRFVRDRDVLLVLDNFEQVADAAPTVDELLAAAPGLRVLVTSRVPLRLYGEWRYPVPPLSVPDPSHLPGPDALAEVDAVRLFVDRARAVRPDFTIGADNAVAIARICARLDGLPLAIELAAARVDLFPPDAILALLDDSLTVLSAGARNLPGRQQSLRGAIAWSVDLLEPSHQRLFRRLAVFYGGFALPEVDIAAGEDADPESGVLGIAALVDASLLRRMDDASGEPRFGMLQTVHEYAVELLVASGEQADVARRHAVRFMTLAEEAAPHLNRPDQEAWFGRLTRSAENLRAALRWAIDTAEGELGLRTAAALWRFWQRRADLREGRETLARLLAIETTGPAVRARALSAAGSLAYWQADTAEAGRLYREALDLDRVAGDPAIIGDDLYNLGFVSMAALDFDTARAQFGQSAEAFRAAGDRRRLAEVSGPLGVIQIQSGNLDDAQHWLEQAREINREIGDRARFADNTMVLGLIHRRRGELDLATTYAREAVALIREIGDDARLPYAIEGVASVALAEGQDRRAVTLAGAASRMRQTLGGVVKMFWDPIDEGLADARSRLGADDYAAAFAEGEAMDVAQAVAYAIGSVR